MDYLGESYGTICLAINILSIKYDNILISIRNSFYYDLVVERDMKLFRVKVINTNCKQSSGSYVANIRKSGGYHAKQEMKSPFKNEMCDFLFVKTPKGNYLIPSSEVKTKKSITLSMFEDFRLD